MAQLGDLIVGAQSVKLSHKWMQHT